MEQNENEVNTVEIQLVSVAFDTVNGTYRVRLPKGSSVNETAFAVSVVIRCLLRDKVIDKASDFTDKIKSYLDDPQWQEVAEDNKEQE